MPCLPPDIPASHCTLQCSIRAYRCASTDALVAMQVMATHGKQITAAVLKDMVYTEAVVRLAVSWLVAFCHCLHASDLVRALCACLHCPFHLAVT